MREPRDMREYAIAHDLVEQQNADGLEQGIAMVSKPWTATKERRDAAIAFVVVVILLALVLTGIWLSVRR